MVGPMDETTPRAAPAPLVAALDRSAADLAAGRVRDARGVQAEARAMIEAHEGADPPPPPPPPPGPGGA